MTAPVQFPLNGQDCIWTPLAKPIMDAGHAGVVELVDAPDSKSGFSSVCYSAAARHLSLPLMAFEFR